MYSGCDYPYKSYSEHAHYIVCNYQDNCDAKLAGHCTVRYKMELIYIYMCILKLRWQS